MRVLPATDPAPDPASRRRGADRRPGRGQLVTGFSDSPPVRLLQGIAVFAAGAVIIGGAVVLAMPHMAGWREPESEEEFEAIVQRAERLAAAGL